MAIMATCWSHPPEGESVTQKSSNFETILFTQANFECSIKAFQPTGRFLQTEKFVETKIRQIDCEGIDGREGYATGHEFCG
jgi:hypothetical protein